MNAANKVLNVIICLLTLGLGVWTITVFTSNTTDVVGITNAIFTIIVVALILAMLIFVVYAYVRYIETQKEHDMNEREIKR